MTTTTTATTATTTTLVSLVLLPSNDGPEDYNVHRDSQHREIISCTITIKHYSR